MTDRALEEIDFVSERLAIRLRILKAECELNELESRMAERDVYWKERAKRVDKEWDEWAEDNNIVI